MPYYSKNSQNLNFNNIGKLIYGRRAYIVSAGFVEVGLDILGCLYFPMFFHLFLHLLSNRFGLNTTGPVLSEKLSPGAMK